MAWTQNYSLASIRGMMPRPYLLELWQATEERRSAAIAAAPAGFAASVEVNAGGYMPAWRPGAAMPSEGWFQAVDTVIDGMLGNFVNQYDEANWDGSATLPLRWDETSMLAQIGAGSRIRMAAGKMLSAEWIRQVYLILDELRWTGRTHNNASAFWDTESGRIADGNAGTWAAAKTAADSAWFSPASSALGPRQHTSGDLNAGTYFARKRSFISKAGTGHGGSIACDIDVYAYIVSPGIYESFTVSDIYDDFGLGLTENRYNLIHSQSFAGPPYTITNVGDLTEPATWCDEPLVDGGGNATHFRGWTVRQGISVMGTTVAKYDVVNGFDKVT